MINVVDPYTTGVEMTELAWKYQEMKFALKSDLILHQPDCILELV